MDFMKIQAVPNKKTMVRLLLLMMLLLCILYTSNPFMSQVSAASIPFTSWTETDPNSKLTQSAARATWTNMIRDEACYLNQTYSFDNVTFLADFQVSSIDVNTDADYQLLTMLLGVQENTGRPLWGESGIHLGLWVLENTTSTTDYKIYFMDTDDNGYANPAYELQYNFTVGVRYWLNWTRIDDWTSALFHSDAPRTVLVENLTIATLDAQDDITYSVMEVTASPDLTADPNDQSDGWIQNLEFYDPAVGGGSSNYIDFSSSPEVNADFIINGSDYATPQTDLEFDLDTIYNLTTELLVTNEVGTYSFSHWLINGTDSYTANPLYWNSSTGNATIALYYDLSASIFVAPAYASDAVNATWYMRSDTHTVHDVLGYKLLSSPTTSETADSRTTAGTHNITYGIRVWVLTYLGDVAELTSETPVALVTRSSNDASIQSATWTCPSYLYVIDAVLVRVYQRFDSDAWSLREIFITNAEALIKFPENTWTVYYYTERSTSSTNSTFVWGSISYNSRIDLQYYRLNPFEVMQYRLVRFNISGFFLTPWTYYLGDLMWAVVLLFACVTTYNWTGSFKVVLGWLWIFGGAGGILSLLIPPLVLNIAWIFLAIAITVTAISLIR